MKKILVLFFMLVAVSFVQADEIDFNRLINETSMPNDHEINAIIDQFNFNFDKKQKEQIFQNAKKKLQDVYSGQSENINGDLNALLEILKNEDSSIFKNPDMKNELLKGIDSLPKK